MIVSMNMSRDVETISPSDPISLAITKMTARRVRRLIVTSGADIVGIVCKSDLVMAFPRHVNPFSPLGAEDPMSANRIETIMRGPAITVGEDEPIEHAAELMVKHAIGCLPVVDHGSLVGIITEGDVFRAFSSILGGDADAVRITFDVTESENILSFLEGQLQKHQLSLLSFVTYHHEERRFAVVRVAGGNPQEFIDGIWDSGHLVVNIVHLESEKTAGAQDIKSE